MPSESTSAHHPGPFPQVLSDGSLAQLPASAPSRVAAVGPYIQSSTMPRLPPRPELLVKPALLEGPPAPQASEGPVKMRTLPNRRTAAALQAEGDGAVAASQPDCLCPTLFFPSQS